jgi:hypothetical protein
VTTRTTGIKSCIHCRRSATRGFDWIPEYGWQCSDVAACDARAKALNLPTSIQCPRCDAGPGWSCVAPDVMRAEFMCPKCDTVIELLGRDGDIPYEVVTYRKHDAKRCTETVAAIMGAPLCCEFCGRDHSARDCGNK